MGLGCLAGVHFSFYKGQARLINAVWRVGDLAGAGKIN